MNELQIGMAGLGVAAVAGVFAFNKWQERKQRQLAERVLERGHTDVLLGGLNTDAPATAGVAPGFAADAGFDADADAYAGTAVTFAAAEGVELADSELSFAADGDLADPLRAAAAFPAAARVSIDGRIEPQLSGAEAEPAELPGLAAEAPPTAAVASRQSAVPEAAELPVSTAAPFVAETRNINPAPATAEAAGVTAAAAVAEPRALNPASAVAEPRVVTPAPSVPGREAPPAALPAARESAPSPLALSPQIDYIAVIDAADPASASQLLRSQREALARLRKPVRWLGCNERSREWEPLREESGAEYRRLRVGLQLVDRRGPINDVELAVFQRAMQDLADELIAVVDLAPAQPALVAAASLDGFCADVDIQIGINVISQGLPFPGSKLRALAEAAGMALDAEGRFVRRDDDGQTLFILCNQESGGFPAEGLKTLTTHGVTFLLDVPRVAHGERVFAQMLDLARRFAATLHGALVDDNRRPLAEGALEPIRRAIAQAQAEMAARQLPAGGALAQRLFA